MALQCFALDQMSEKYIYMEKARYLQFLGHFVILSNGFVKSQEKKAKYCRAFFGPNNWKIADVADIYVYGKGKTEIEL